MLTTPESAAAVEALLALAFVLMGLSHIIQPAMWRVFFTRLHGEGPPGVITRSFSLELWPAITIITFHQVWSGPAVALTIYGYLLSLKITASLLCPAIGLRSLSMAESKGDRGFQGAGVVLLVMAGVCLVSLFA